MPTYWEKLQRAFQLTNEQGYSCPYFAQTTGGILTAAHGAELMEALDTEYSGLKSEDLAFQCANVHWRMKPIFENIIGAPALLTVGSVSYKNTPLCTVTSLRPEDMRRTGNFHVWWSLTSGEVVDLTLMLSLCFAKNLPLERAQPLAGRPEGIPAVTWEPIMVGDEVTCAILTCSP